MTRRQTPQQLSLPGSLDEVVMLREALARAQASADNLQEDLWHTRDQLDSANDAYERLQRNHEQLQRAYEQLQREYATQGHELSRAQQWVDIWKGLVDLGRSSAAPQPSPDPWIARQLTQILAIAHPDKWTQGQPATMVAHEVTVALNGLRQRLQAGGGHE